MNHSKLLMILLIVSAVAAGCSKPKDPENVAEMRKKLGKDVRLALWKVDATDAQRADMNRLLDSLAGDFFAFQQEDKTIKRGIIAALEADPVDVKALEALQKQGLGLFDRYTQRLLGAAVETSRILERSQRRELLTLWREYEFDE